EVMEVNFVDGSAVSENQVLLRLDDAEQRIAVSLAEVELQEAERQVKRFERLAPSGSVARASLDTARAGRDSARLRLEQAMEALTDRTVFAPFDGIIGLSEIHRGDRVSPETLIATLDDRTSLLVEFDISEQFVPRIRPGNDIELFAWTHPETVLRGEILAMGSQIDPSTRALRTRAIVPNPGGDIRPGTSFEVRLDLKGRSYPSVAEVAVLWSRDGPYVWRIRDDQTVEKVFSTIVRRDKGRVLLDGNLSVEDNIVVEGVQGLRDGTLVAPLSEERQKSEGEGRETS
ncbi:MAG: efflux RND transporter periplasmic adaptor subunit, partial [Pseudomonadota bacterium]